MGSMADTCTSIEMNQRTAGNATGGRKRRGSHSGERAPEVFPVVTGSLVLAANEGNHRAGKVRRMGWGSKTNEMLDFCRFGMSSVSLGKPTHKLQCAIPRTRCVAERRQGLCDPKGLSVGASYAGTTDQ